MRQIILALSIFFASFGMAKADPVAIQKTINNQIEAFKADDFDLAFTFASPNIQRIFQSPERFGQMVTNGYPMVHRPSAVEFQDLRTLNGGQHQEVLIQDGRGVYFLFDYRMIMVNDVWRIDGVQLLQRPEYGA